MTPNLTVYRISLLESHLAAITEIKTSLHADLQLANQVSWIDKSLDITMYVRAIKSLLEIQQEARNNEFKFNRLILKLAICKLELLLSAITVQSDLQGLLLFNHLNVAKDRLTAIYDDLEEMIWAESR